MVLQLRGTLGPSPFSESSTSRSCLGRPLYCAISAHPRSNPLPLQHASCARPSLDCHRNPCSRVRHLASLVMRAGNGSPRDPLEDYVEVKVDRVAVNGHAAIVYLKSLDRNQVIPVHIGKSEGDALVKERNKANPVRRENESNALLKEINKTKHVRPLTHDMTKSLLSAMGCRVTKVRITEIVSNTYYARIHIAGPQSSKPANANPLTGGAAGGFAAAFGAAAAAAAGAASGGSANSPNSSSEAEVEVDARPSDAINMAVRFGAKMYVKRSIMDEVAAAPHDVYPAAANESHAEVVRSVRDVLASYDDPTVMHVLKKDLAIKEERFEDASKIQQELYHEMTHNSALRLVVAMEAALADGRYEEAARLRDEFKKELSNPTAKSSVI